MNLRDFTSSFGRPSLTISTLGEASSSPDEESGGAVTVAVVVGALAVAGVAGYLLLAGDGNGASSSDSFGVLHRADGRKMTKADIKHLQLKIDMNNPILFVCLSICSGNLSDALLREHQPERRVVSRFAIR